MKWRGAFHCPPMPLPNPYLQMSVCCKSCLTEHYRILPFFATQPYFLGVCSQMASDVNYHHCLEQIVADNRNIWIREQLYFARNTRSRVRAAVLGTTLFPFYIYDVIFDVVGKHAFRRCKVSLSRSGSYLATYGLQNLILALWISRIGDKKVRFSIPPRYTKQDVVFLKQLIEAGRFRPVIDRCYPLEDVVEAARYVETEQKTGNVVLMIYGGRAR